MLIAIRHPNGDMLARVSSLDSFPTVWLHAAGKVWRFSLRPDGGCSRWSSWRIGSGPKTAEEAWAAVADAPEKSLPASAVCWDKDIGSLADWRGGARPVCLI